MNDDIMRIDLEVIKKDRKLQIINAIKCENYNSTNRICELLPKTMNALEESLKDIKDERIYEIMDDIFSNEIWQNHI